MHLTLKREATKPASGLQDRVILVTRLRPYLSGQGKISFTDYDLGYIDLEEKTLQPLNNPFGAKV
jgi:hypothetical protein